MPRLTLPFAVVGAAAGWLSADFLDNPLVGVTPSHAEGLATVCTAAIAAGVGRALTRRCAPREDWVEDGASTWVQLAVWVLGGGIASGAVIGLLGFGNLRGTVSGLFAGLCAGAAFLPVCALVVAAGRRAARARLGSLVADADRREMWAILATALAVMTLVSLPDWLAGEPSVTPGVMAGTALGAVVALFALDLGACRQVRRAASSTDGMVLREADAAEPDDPEPLIDFGLGDEFHARIARSAAAYRDRSRTAALVAGSPDQAVRAVERALLQKGAALAAAVAVVAAHCFARELPASLLAHEMACDVGVISECGVAAGMMFEESSPRLHLRARVLAELACHHPSRSDAQACRLLARMAEREPAGDVTPYDYRRRACLMGDVAACRLAAWQLLDGEGVGRSRWGAAALLDHACEGGDRSSCPEAQRARDLARRLGN
jgi:hypothetical protein